MLTVHERFDRWASSVGGYRAAATLIGCDPGYPHKLAHDRKPGLHIAHAIERATSGWDEGQIRTEDWDPKALLVVRERARRAQREVVLGIALRSVKS